MRHGWRVILGGLLLAAATVTHAAETKAQSGPTIHLCGTAALSKPQAVWTAHVRQALGRLVDGGYLSHKKGYRISLVEDEKCPALEEKACRAEMNKVYCDLDKLSRVLSAQAWLAAGYGLHIADRKSSRISSVFSATQAFKIVDSQFSLQQGRATEPFFNLVQKEKIDPGEWAAAAVIVKRLQQYDLDDKTSEAARKLDPAVLLAYGIYEAASNYVIGFILAHELSYAYGDCSLRDPAKFEKRGRFDRVVNLQAGGNLFCPNPPSATELLADRCAVRVLEKLDRDLTQAKKERDRGATSEDSRMGSLSAGRRVAVDTFSWLIASGSATHTIDIDDLAHNDLTFEKLDQYAWLSRKGHLYPPIRQLLLTQTLRLQDEHAPKLVRICDASAQRFVLGLNVAFFGCDQRKQEIRRGTKHPRDYQSKLTGELYQDVSAGVILMLTNGDWRALPIESYRCE